MDVIRSKALETLVNCTRDVQVSLLELKKLGIVIKDTPDGSTWEKEER